MEDLLEKTWERLITVYDVIVIGSGVGGYPAAIYLASHGYKTAIIEEHLIGGECTNYGCVPSKALYHMAQAISALEKIDADININFKNIRKFIIDQVDRTRKGIEYLLEKSGVEIIRGHARFTSPGEVRVRNNVYRADKYIIATGTRPRCLPGLVFDGKIIVSNRHIFSVEEAPESLAIIGGGVIGIEIGNIFADLGVNVTVIEALDHILPFLDRDVALTIKRYLRSKTISIYEKTTATKISADEGQAKILLSNGENIVADKVLISIGRTPNTGDLGLFEAGVETDEKGFIKLVDGYQTHNPRIYAVGDVIGGPLLAHKAIIESILAAKQIMGEKIKRIEYHMVPQTIFSGLEYAGIGYTEKELKARGIKYKKLRAPLSFLSAVRIKGPEYCFAKILVDNKDNVLGIHIVAPQASEVISAYVPLYLAKLTPEELATFPYPHLTVSESLRDIGELLLGESIHLLKLGRKR